MGSKGKFFNWYIYIVVDYGVIVEFIYIFEMCMIKFDRQVVGNFVKVFGLEIGFEMMKVVNIDNILFELCICDFVFDLCGYFMNGIEGVVYFIIYVIFEDGLSYVSYEVMGYNLWCVDLLMFVERVVVLFKFVVFVMFVYVFDVNKVIYIFGLWDELLCLKGYICDGSSCQELFCGGIVVFYMFKEIIFFIVKEVSMFVEFLLLF